MPERRTEGNECGLLPTPTAGDSRAARNKTAGRSPDSQHHYGITLTDAMWMGLLPTPDANCWKQGEKGSGGKNGGSQLSEAHPLIAQTGTAGPMRLNPLFVAWMMGYPPGWLDVECRPSRRSATP
jgi:hypothetical protein